MHILKNYYLLGLSISILLFYFQCTKIDGRDYNLIPDSGILWDNSNFLKPDKESLRKKLNEIQFFVTQENSTEIPFYNEYWNYKSKGIYVDVVSGEPLFSSSDKFDSGSGWPSFTKPIQNSLIVYKVDMAYGMKRIEVRSKLADSHLGHVFEDGPPPTKLRYCINSASLRFIPLDYLAKEGYGKYKKIFN